MSIRLRLSILVLCMGFSIAIEALEHNFIPKIGYSKWSQDTFSLKNSTIKFKNHSDIILGFQYRIISDSGLSLGYESLYNSIDIIADSAGYAGYANVYHDNLLLQYHLFGHKSIRPYIGIGSGRTTISIHSATNARLTRSSSQISTGVEYIFNRRIGIAIGFQRIKISADDAEGSKIDTRSNILAIEFMLKAGRNL